MASAAMKRPLLVVAGVGNGTGTGAATAWVYSLFSTTKSWECITSRLFAKSGYRVALIARNEHNLKATAEDIKAKGGEVRFINLNPRKICHCNRYWGSTQAAPFPVPSYKPQDLTNVFHQIKEFWPDSELRVAVWNAGQFVWKPFLQLTDDDVEQALDTNVRAAFAFSRGSLLAFQENELDHLGKKGTLIFTGATASLKGNKATSAFSAAKFGLRSLSQSLNKEFGPQNIHVSDWTPACAFA